MAASSPTHFLHSMLSLPVLLRSKIEHSHLLFWCDHGPSGGAARPQTVVIYCSCRQHVTGPTVCAGGCCMGRANLGHRLLGPGWACWANLQVALQMAKDIQQWLQPGLARGGGHGCHWRAVMESGNSDDQPIAQRLSRQCGSCLVLVHQ